MILRRIGSVVPLLLVVSFAVFALEGFLPGDAAASLAGPNATEERVEEIRQELRLDEPMLERYGTWVANATQGDLGRSLFTRRPVTTELADRVTVTLWLVGGALLVSLVLGVPLGIAAGRRYGGLVDRLAGFGATLGVAVPHFVLGMVGVIVFALWLNWLPITGYVPMEQGIIDWFRHLLLPVLALAGIVTAEVSRHLRSSLHETLGQQYIRNAHAKGLRERTILFKHAMRVAMVPAVAVMSVQAARLFGAAVIVEEVFRLPGLGRFTVQAILNRDLPVLQGVIPIAVAIAVLAALAADLVQLRLDPRLRLEEAQ